VVLKERGKKKESRGEEKIKRGKPAKAPFQPPSNLFGSYNKRKVQGTENKKAARGREV